MGTRHHGRIMAMQMLYGLDTSHFEGQLKDHLNSFSDHFVEKPSEDSLDFAEKLCNGFLDHKELIDSAIEKGAVRWRLTRMNRVDRSILRLAVYELMFEPETPPQVIINEAIELGKQFGAEETSAFINGVLNQILKMLKINPTVERV